MRSARLVAVGLLTAALTATGAGVAVAATTEQQNFTGTGFYPDYAVAHHQAQVRARQAATGAGYAPDEQCRQSGLRASPPNQFDPNWYVQYTLTCTR